MTTNLIFERGPVSTLSQHLNVSVVNIAFYSLLVPVNRNNSSVESPAKQVFPRTRHSQILQQLMNLLIFHLCKDLSSISSSLSHSVRMGFTLPRLLALFVVMHI
jgi:hypothetical protein